MLESTPNGKRTCRHRYGRPLAPCLLISFVILWEVSEGVDLAQELIFFHNRFVVRRQKLLEEILKQRMILLRPNNFEFTNSRAKN